MVTTVPAESSATLHTASVSASPSISTAGSGCHHRNGPERHRGRCGCDRPQRDSARRQGRAALASDRPRRCEKPPPNLGSAISPQDRAVGYDRLVDRPHRRFPEAEARGGFVIPSLISRVLLRAQCNLTASIIGSKRLSVSMTSAGWMGRVRGVMIKIAAGAAILCSIGFGLGVGLTKLADQRPARDASAPSLMRHSSQMQAPEGQSPTAR